MLENNKIAPQKWNFYEKNSNILYVHYFIFFKWTFKFFSLLFKT
jgi:hypothetical protein